MNNKEKNSIEYYENEIVVDDARMHHKLFDFLIEKM